MEEIWKDLNFSSDYQVSNLGQVRSRKKYYYNQILKQQTNRQGYKTVHLHINKKSKACSVHRLVLMAFCPIKNPELYDVNHKDENKTNNCLNNLEWLTHYENIKYGTGEQRAHESQKDKIFCVETGIIYSSMKEASDKTGINYGNISSCCRGKLKTAGGFHWQNLTNKRKETWDNKLYV